MGGGLRAWSSGSNGSVGLNLSALLLARSASIAFHLTVVSHFNIGDYWGGLMLVSPEASDIDSDFLCRVPRLHKKVLACV